MKKEKQRKPSSHKGNKGRCAEAMLTPQLRRLSKAIASHPGGPLLDLANAIAAEALPGPWTIRIKYIK